MEPCVVGVHASLRRICSVDILSISLVDYAWCTKTRSFCVAVETRSTLSKHKSVFPDWYNVCQCLDLFSLTLGVSIAKCLTLIQIYQLAYRCSKFVYSLISFKFQLGSLGDILVLVLILRWCQLWLAPTIVSVQQFDYHFISSFMRRQCKLNDWFFNYAYCQFSEKNASFFQLGFGSIVAIFFKLNGI